MSEADNVQKIQVPPGTDWLTLANEKAGIYANDLVNNPARLKDPAYCKLAYGAFSGSEGDYSFHQRSTIEQMAVTIQVVEVNRPKPSTLTEHAAWFLDSVLSGSATEARNSVFARQHFNYQPGEMYQALHQLATDRGLSSASAQSVCEAFNNLSQMVDYHLPYLPDGQQAHINIVFKSDTPAPPNHEDRSKPESLRLGDPLPEYYVAPLKEISNIAPEGFLGQSIRAAYYLHALDQGIELFDQNGNSLQAEVNRFADEMADLPAIHLVYVFGQLARSQRKNAQEPDPTNSHVKSRRAFDSVPPEEALPHWVTSRIHWEQPPEQDGSNIPQASEFYLQYAPTHGERRDLTHGTYYYYDRDISPPQGESPVDIFKCYLEQDIPQDQMTVLFAELASLKIHPHSSKLFEGDRIVLYWDSYLSEELSTQLKQTFEKHHIPYRGFGQDSIQVKVGEDGKWEFGARSSNDQSRGEAGGASDFHQHEYSPRKFFELYLQQMMRHCRNPLDPYRMSFVPVNGENTMPLVDQDKLSRQLAEIEKRGLDVVWYKDGVPIPFR